MRCDRDQQLGFLFSREAVRSRPCGFNSRAQAAVGLAEKNQEGGVQLQQAWAGVEAGELQIEAEFELGPVENLVNADVHSEERGRRLRI